MQNEEPSIEKMNTTLRESMDTMQNKTQKPTIKKGTEDTEIETLDKKRKELRPKNRKQKQTNNKQTNKQINKQTTHTR